MTTHQQLHHLHLRAGFAPSPHEWATLPTDRAAAVERLFQPTVRAEPLTNPHPSTAEQTQMIPDRKERRKMERERVLQTTTDWLARMASDEQPALLERMTLFWHGHFACECKTGFLAHQYLDTLRRHALGNFRELTLAVARDPAMIRYLNNQQNRKQSPNENFARELLELFTIGRGNYTETDVKEAARAFTGWSSNRTGAFVFRERQHDFGPKTFFGKTGDWNGDDIVDFVLARPETARFVVRKMYRYFVHRSVDEQRVEALARNFRRDYEIAPLLRRMFLADWFYAPENVGTKIKSPVDLLVGLMRQLQLTPADNRGTALLLRALGQTPFRPPNVAGWVGARAWIDNATLQTRLNLAAGFGQLLQPEATTNQTTRPRRLRVTADLEPLRALATPTTEPLTRYLLAPNLSPDAALIRRAAARSEDPVLGTALALMSLPEYQLS